MTTQPRIQERNPAKPNAACPKAGMTANDGAAPEPLTACKDCPHLSFANCLAPDLGESVHSI